VFAAMACRAVCISSEDGAGAHEAALLAAQSLGFRLIDEDIVARNLYAPDMPDPDLVIRTSGELRISNFLLWQSAYAEFVFTETLWPDFGPRELRAAIEDYASRRRRFGGR